MLFNVIIVESDAEQPFTGSEILSRYVPGMFVLGVSRADEKLLGPDQLYVTPVVFDTAESFTNGFLHVISQPLAETPQTLPSHEPRKSPWSKCA